MTHVATHCGSVGLPDDPPEIPITIHNHTRLNLAIALKRWPDESDSHWSKRQAKLDKLKHKIYALAQMTSADEIHYHPPSYVHDEPPHDH
jgi:hypothetical protein